MALSQKAKNAVFMGTLCSVSYLAVYVAKNILSAVTPLMVADGYAEAYIGQISSVYFICYAIGQLINGAIGDKVKAKWMISLGLFCAGATVFVFPYIAKLSVLSTVVYGLTGFSLSMIYGPMAKVVSENTELKYATRCSLGYTFSSFFGSPAAGILASFLAWQSVFTVSSAVLIGMATVSFVFFSVFERKKIVQYGLYKSEKKRLGNVKDLLHRDIVKFALIAILTGVVRTSVVFWLPTYLVQYLAFTPQSAAKIFTVATFVISFTAFIAVFIYERLGRDRNKTILLAFASAALCFILTYFVSHPVLNIVCIVLAIMSSNAASSMIWSSYCPSLYDTGMVSTVTGFLDCLSYIAAAAANLIFANAATSLGWGKLILVWFALMIAGVVIALPYGKCKTKKNKE